MSQGDVVSVASALAFPSFAAAAPVVRTGPAGGLERTVRWVHSSEVLDIGHLLRGGEILLTAGSGLQGLGEEGLNRYLRALAERQLAALAVEVRGWKPAEVDRLAAGAERAGILVVELHETVRFVDITEEVNSFIVNRQARHHTVVDDMSRQVSGLISTQGPQVHEILALAERTLGARVRFAGADDPLEEEPGERSEGMAHAAAVVLVGGHLAGHLMLESASEPVELLSIAASRLAEVLAMALAPSFSPSPEQLAEAKVMLAILDGAPHESVDRLWTATTLPAGPACVAYAVPIGTTLNHERVLRRVVQRAVGATWKQGRALLVPLAGADPVLRRAGLVRTLEAAVAEIPAVVAVGPLVWDGGLSYDSFRDAVQVLEDHDGSPAVLDATALFAARVARHLEAADFVPLQVRATLGRLMAWDAKYGTRLVETLGRWLDCGCNTTAAAAVLHVERQSLHKRLSKVFELVGGDPRVTGEVFALHVATSVALRHDVGGPR
jgi:PucR family transcriptional regulator, purine catabolism regulatory protein